MLQQFSKTNRSSGKKQAINSSKKFTRHNTGVLEAIVLSTEDRNITQFNKLQDWLQTVRGSKYNTTVGSLIKLLKCFDQMRFAVCTNQANQERIN